MAENTPRFGCPRCKSEDIQEANVAYAYLPITAWNDDGSPAEFDSDVDVEWESDPEAFPELMCGGCGGRFGWEHVIPLPQVNV